MKRPSNRIVCRIVLTLALLSISACSMARGYRGSSKSADELATVRAHGVTIHQVNDVEIGATAPGVLIPAGTNKVYLSINASNFNSPENNAMLRELTVELAAGEEYVITGSRGDGRVCAYPVDEQTGEPVFENPAGCL